MVRPNSNKVNKRNIKVRIAEEFNNEIEDIKIKRLELGGNNKKFNSSRILTKLLIKHNYWNKMKKDIINYRFTNGREIK